MDTICGGSYPHLTPSPSRVRKFLNTLLTVAGYAVAAKSEGNGEPFKAIWDAIHALRNEQLHLYDGKGQDLGIFLTADFGIAQGTYDAYIESVGGKIKVYALPISQKVEIGVINFDIYFEGRDCTGKAFGS